MNKWILFACGALAACLTNCKNAAEEAICETIDMTTVFDWKPEELQLDKWAKSIRFIPLETNDSLLLTNNVPYLIYRDHKLVIYNKDNLYVFNENGKLLNKVGNRGEGPEDFNFVSNIWADKDAIYLTDNETWIKVYGWDGKWQKTTPIPTNKNIKEVLYLSDGRKIGYVQNISGKEPVKMHIFRDSTVLSSIPYSRNYEPGAITMVFYNECKTFTSPGGDPFVKEMFNDTIYRITDQHTIVPRWVVDAGKYKLADGARYALKDRQANLFANAANISVVGESGNTLYFSARANKAKHLLAYDRQKKETHNLVLTYPENAFAFEEGKTFVPGFISDDNQYLIGLEPQENDENPVIILVER